MCPDETFTTGCLRRHIRRMRKRRRTAEWTACSEVCMIEVALAEALMNGVIGGAGFDVLTKEPPLPENPLLGVKLPNFILTPHVAWASGGAMQTLADMLIDNIEGFEGGNPINVV